MKITKFLHSCVLVEDNGSKVLIDPGAFSFEPGKVEAKDVKGISAIFITHAHTDHLDVEVIKVLLNNNPECNIFANADSGKLLEQAGIAYELFNQGDREVAGFKVTAFSAPHQPIFDFPMPENTAFLLNEKFLHPGDSYADSVFEYKPEILALAVAGPWMNMNQGFDFSQKCSARKVIPIHDGHIKEFFSANMYNMWEKVLGAQGVQFEKLLKPGDSVEV
ncbi:MBL fold metallo-hydrolase [Patescibacteria group bacterium]|nr:MBL fold metallo-hydrolase [Patescibacteria group bacterium]